MEREKPYKELVGREFVTNEFGEDLKTAKQKYSHLGIIHAEEGLFEGSIAVYLWTDGQAYWSSLLANGLQELDLPIEYDWERRTVKTKKGKELHVSFSEEYKRHWYSPGKREIGISAKDYERSYHRKDDDIPQHMARWFLHELGHAEAPTIVIFKYLPLPIGKVANWLYEIPAEVYAFKKLGMKRWIQLSLRD